MNIRFAIRARHTHRLLWCALAWLGGAGLTSMGVQARSASAPAIIPQQSFEAQMALSDSHMMQAMQAAPRTGQPDHDFASMMIPHHQGAIDMAKAELLYGKDPVLRRIAQEIIVTQQQEILVMRLQLKQLEKAAPSQPFKPGDSP